ncbi:MAG: oxalate/formate MFS antiporter [Gammaproteobacteria bacterium]|nr:oxalate/formate MFS antiporter [Gammaproteobacteria bacterium]
MKILYNRWSQLSLSVVVLIIISGPQYLWALFVRPLLDKLDVPLSELQVVFSLVVVCMTFITPLAGYLHDRFNSKNIVAVGLLMCSGSWVIASYAESLLALYLSYGIMGGLGAGIAFIGVTGQVLKCFPDKRGLATGILMSGYAFGPLFSTYAVSHSVNIKGVENTLYYFGLLFIVISIVVISGLRLSSQISIPNVKRTISTGVSAVMMLKTPVFWLMFAIMIMVAASGMMVTSNIAIIAHEAGIGSEIVMFGLAALPLALMLDRITNGLSRILFGSLSDKLGRENTLALAFSLEALFVVCWFSFAHNPIAFILLSGLVFLAWGEIFSIFPALCTDTFGEKNASVNFGFLYISVGIGAIFGGPLAALLREMTGSWSSVIYIVAVADLLAAIMAFTVLKKWVNTYKKENVHQSELDIQNSTQIT